MAVPHEPERRELVLSSLSPERRQLVMELLLSSGAKYSKDDQGGYTAVLQMEMSPDLETTPERRVSWSNEREGLMQDSEQVFHEVRDFQEDPHSAANLASSSGRKYSDVMPEELHFASGLEGSIRGHKARQHLEKLWGQSASLTKVGSKVMTRWSNAEARELRAEDFALPFVVETAERFEEVAAALTPPRGPVKQRPLNWILKAIDELFDKRYALEISEQKAAVDAYTQSRRRSHDSQGSDHSAEDAPSTSGSDVLEGNASFAVFLLQTYRKKYGLRQLAEGAVWELLCNVARGEQQDLHPAIASLAGFLAGQYSNDDLEFFLYCRQKVSAELQRNPSHVRRNTDAGLATATLRKEQTVSMTRAVLGKVAGGPLLAELCHAIEQFFEGQLESTHSRKMSRGERGRGTISAYQYLKLVMDSYRATIVSEIDEGLITSHESSEGEDDGIYAENEEGWDAEEEAEPEHRESQEDERLIASGLANRGRFSTGLTGRSEPYLVGLTREERRPCLTEYSDDGRPERPRSSNGSEGDGTDPVTREFSTSVGRAHQEEKGETDISATSAGGRLSWSERFERLLQGDDERNGGESKPVEEDVGDTNGQNDGRPFQAGDSGASLVEDSRRSKLLGSQRNSFHRKTSSILADQVVGVQATALDLPTQTFVGFGSEPLTQSTSELDNF
ncbi:crooked neck [Klebsormidium nitens]|uniref:Crooked neck n=1 Tax=Klebsormidium nitens TaxID=105231 RepID=A0A1Y1IMD0_KLENI|nr:crooked neck [Klebsormidium nitens]|eukprot:GAQ90301.1 crooked neck [Klebsormidium nitens]